MSEIFLDYYDGWQSFLGLVVGHSCVESVTARSLNMRNILETGECIDAAVRLGEGGQNKRRGRRRARTREKLWLTVMLGRGRSGGAQKGCVVYKLRLYFPINLIRTRQTISKL